MYEFGWVSQCVRKRGERRHPRLPTISNQAKAKPFIANTDVFWLFWCWCADWCEQVMCWLKGYKMWLLPSTPAPPLKKKRQAHLNLFLLPSARPPSFLRWRAHHQKLPGYSSRRPAQRPPRGWTYRRSVPGCHVHTPQTSHTHCHQQPSAGSARRQRLKWPLIDVVS